MSISYYDKSGDEPVKVLLAGTSATDLLLDPNSTNAIANRAVYVALSEKIDMTVRNLLYYYTKEQVFTKEEVQDLLATLSTMDIRVVSDLPTSDISTSTIYFLESALTEGVYDQYVYVQGAWVKIGDTDVDLSDYLKNEDFVIRIADYYTKTQIDALIATYYTKTQIDDFLADKQDKLTFDSTPTTGSNNPVTSKGIKAAIDAVKGGTGSNPNILDNGHFQVNQLYGRVNADQSMTFGGSYANKLTIDRWWHKLGNGGTLTHYKNDGNRGPKIVIASSGQWGRIEQFIPKATGDQLIGKKIVMSLIVSVSSATRIRLRFNRYNGGTILDSSSEYIYQDFDVPAGANHRLIVSNAITVPPTSSTYTHYSFLIYPQYSGGSTARTGIDVSIHAAKIEISDGGSTLAKDALPNYQTELLKCQKYRYVIRGMGGTNVYIANGVATDTHNIRFILNTPGVMAGKVSKTFSGSNWLIFRPGGGASTVPSSVFETYQESIISSAVEIGANIPGATYTSGAQYFLGIGNGYTSLEICSENSLATGEINTADY
jgi:hypothetical protein